MAIRHSHPTPNSTGTYPCQVRYDVRVSMKGGHATRILVLWANESSPNLGVAALARGSQHLLRRAYPDAEITFANYGSRPAAIPWGQPRSLIRERVLPRHGMQNYLSQFDLVWDTRSGDSFTSIYGTQRHLTMSLIHEFAAQARTKTVMAPQTIGPFGTRASRILARRTLMRSKFVFARDPESAQAAATLGRLPDITTTDLAFAIDPPMPSAPRDVLLNVSGLLWSENPHVSAKGYRHALKEIALRLRAAGRQVTLLAHVLDSPDPDNDVPAIRALGRELGDDVELVIPTSLDSVREAIGSSQLVIGARMHACLNALSTGVPTIPLAYSRKFAPLLQSVGWQFTFDLRTQDLDALPQAVVAATSKVTKADAEAAARAGREGLQRVAELLRADV